MPPFGNQTHKKRPCATHEGAVRELHQCITLCRSDQGNAEGCRSAQEDAEGCSSAQEAGRVHKTAQKGAGGRRILTKYIVSTATGHNARVLEVNQNDHDRVTHLSAVVSSCIA